TACSKCGLHERGAQRTVALARLAAAPLAGTLVLSRAQASPRGEMAWAGEAVHVWANFGNDDLGDSPRHTGDRVESVEHLFKRTLTLSDLRIELLQPLIQEVDMRQDLRHQKALMRTEPSCQRAFKCGLFVAEAPTGEVGERGRVRLASY